MQSALHLMISHGVDGPGAPSSINPKSIITIYSVANLRNFCWKQTACNYGVNSVIIRNMLAAGVASGVAHYY